MPDEEWEIGLELDPVFEWRRDELVNAGLDTFSAFRLAAVPELDLHKLIEHARNGWTGRQLTDLYLD